MVSARKLMQLLHCRRTHRRARSSCSDDEEPTTSTPQEVFETENQIKREGITIKIETPEGMKHTICRVCLQDGNIPIYGDDIYNDVSQELNIFTAVNVQKNDDHPQHLCDKCYSLLQGAIQLRSTAQYSQQVLLDQISETHHTVDHDYYKKSPNRQHTMDEDNHYEEPIHTQRKSSERIHCSKCMIYFDNEQAFHEHRLSEEHKKLKKPCPVCGKEYVAKYLRSHLKYHNTKILEVCDVCGKKFTVRGHFVQHRKIHIHELPYKCEFCPYRCRFNYALKLHLRTHTGERPYKCEICPNKTFISKGNLNSHMLTHKSKHAFRCDICQRGFHKKVGLEIHVKIRHDGGVKDHICDICNKAFCLSMQLNKHKLKVHQRQLKRSGIMPLYLREEYQLKP